MARSKSQGPHAEVEQLRERIVKVQEDIHAAKRLPQTATEARSNLDQAITDAASRYHKGKPFTGLAYGRMDGIHALAPSADLVVPFIASVAGDAIRETIGAALERHCEDAGATLTSSERDQHIRDLEAQRLELEREEERIIDTARHQGIHIPRRRDASPAVVLFEGG